MDRFNIYITKKENTPQYCAAKNTYTHTKQKKNYIITLFTYNVDASVSVLCSKF